MNCHNDQHWFGDAEDVECRCGRMYSNEPIGHPGLYRLDGEDIVPVLEPMDEWPPPGAVLLMEFAVLGHARTAGSKVSGVAYRKDANGKSVPVTKEDGKIVTFTKDSSGKEGENWRKDVRETAAALKSTPELFDGALILGLTFFRPRIAGHKGTGRNAGVVKESAPAYPNVQPDALKLARAIEDAFNKVVYRDDARIVDGRQAKRFGEPERVEVRLWSLPATVAEYRAYHGNPELVQDLFGNSVAAVG